MLICPSQRKLTFIENEFVKNNFGLYRLTCLYNLMTLLLLNSEPLIFQVTISISSFNLCKPKPNIFYFRKTFQAKDGWPFPEYYGACGRVVVEEYVGPNLAQWLPKASWKEKLNAALSLLKIAEQFTQGAFGFRLYVTDVSLYNIAVAPDGSLKVIDGGNIVLVDLEEIQQGSVSIFNYKNILYCFSLNFRSTRKL